MVSSLPYVPTLAGYLAGTLCSHCGLGALIRSHVISWQKISDFYWGVLFIIFLNVATVAILLRSTYAWASLR